MSKSMAERIDDILVDPASRTETDPEGDWSSTRFALILTLVTFLSLSVEDAEFRDAAAFVTVILALIGAVVAPKILDLRMAIGQAAAAIGKKFTRKQETVTTTVSDPAPSGDVAIEAENVTVTEEPIIDPPAMGSDPADDRDG